MSNSVIYTIGYTKKSAEEFFARLKSSNAKHLLDIRLKNTSQLSGFAKRDDLRYFLRELLNMEYHELPEFAPDVSMLKQYLNTKDWNKYVLQYSELLRTRRPENKMSSKLIDEGIVFLCSEAKADQCHRRLAAEWIVKTHSPNTSIVHL